MLRSWLFFHSIGSELLRAYTCWFQYWHVCLPTSHAESPHLGFCCLLYSQFTTIVSASWADCVVNVVSATVRAKCQCRHFCFVVCTTFRLSGVRLSSFWMCHNCLLFYLVYFNCCVQGFQSIVQPRRTTVRYSFRPCYIIYPRPTRCRGGFGEVHPFVDCNHHLGDYAPAGDSL